MPVGRLLYDRAAKTGESPSGRERDQALAEGGREGSTLALGLDSDHAQRRSGQLKKRRLKVKHGRELSFGEVASDGCPPSESCCYGMIREGHHDETCLGAATGDEEALFEESTAAARVPSKFEIDQEEREALSRLASSGEPSEWAAAGYAAEVLRCAAIGALPSQRVTRWFLGWRKDHAR